MGQLSGGLHRSWVTIYDPLSALQNGIKRYGRNTNRKSYVFCPMAPFSIIIEHVLRSNQETIYFSLKKLSLVKSMLVEAAATTVVPYVSCP